MPGRRESGEEVEFGGEGVVNAHFRRLAQEATQPVSPPPTYGYEPKGFKYCETYYAYVREGYRATVEQCMAVCDSKPSCNAIEFRSW